MYGFRRSANLLCAACAVIVLTAFTAHTAWSQQDAARAALANWLECENCEHDELAAVTRYGQAIVPELIAALNQDPSSTPGDLHTALEERYEQLVEQSKKNPHAPIAVSKEKFVDLYGGLLNARHRVRAAQALAAIGGERARAALEAAAGHADRDDVRNAARESLRKLAR